MAARLTTAERRAAGRVAPGERGWQSAAVLRPGLEVDILDLSPGGARIASTARLKPGARAELHLTGAGRRVIAGRISRCRVMRLMPLRYEGAMVFDERLDG
jgi:PilZ domain